MKKFHLVPITLLLVASGQVSANLVNGDFDSGLTGWTSAGVTNDTTSTSTNFYGDTVAALNGDMARVDSGDDFNDEGFNPLTSTIESVLGVANGGFNALAPTHQNPSRTVNWVTGAAIYQDITLAAEGSISFDWNFLTDDIIADSWPIDAVFMVLDGNVTMLTNTVDNGGAGSYGWTSLELDVAAGTHRLGFVALNDFDWYGGSQLLVDNVSTSVVPVPAAVWLFGSALAGLGWMRRKQAV
jgi:hypothetical protein